MKKFITILSALILMSIAYTAQAQYISKYRVHTTVEQLQTPETGPEFDLLESPEFKEALEKSQKGHVQFYTGLGLDLLASTLFCVPIICDYEDTITGISYIAGGACLIAGTIFEIAGLSKWISGETTLRNLRIQYAVEGNGIIVAF